MPPVATSAPPVQPLTGAVARRRIPWWAGVLAVAGLVGLVVLARVEPAGQGFFPRCWLFQTTGLRCPGCGATRALHALLHGNLTEAIRLNALLVLALPAGAWLALRGMRGWWTGRWWRDPVTHPAGLAVLSGLAMGFGLARNFAW